MVFTGFAAVFALLFIGFKSPALFNRNPQTAILPPIKIAALTNAGKAVSAAISPDGKYVAYAEEKDGAQELRLTRVANYVDSGSKK